MTIEGICIFTGRAIRVELQGDTIAVVTDIQAGNGLPYLSPGFVDMQVNGYQGMDYSSDSFTEADVERLIKALATSGTTIHVPTIISMPEETIVRNLGKLAKAREASPEAKSAIPGYHIEGPFISPEDGPRGAHDRANVRAADFEEYRRWQDAARGRIKIVTVAPEVPGALSFIERITEEGVLAAVGHTGASPEAIRDAIKAGARLSTHLGNGSHAMIPRLKNYLWEQLAADELVAGIITDGYHLPPAVVRTIARAKGLERLFLVSDVAVHGGAKPGVYRWGANMVEVFPDGHLGLHKTEFLAGAGHLLDRDAAMFTNFAGARLSDTVRLFTVNPARLLGLPDREHYCVEGAAADLVLFNHSAGSERLEIRETIQAGRVLYEQERQP